MVRRILSDSQWAPCGAAVTRKGRRSWTIRKRQSGVPRSRLWIARTGSPWRDLPDEFGLWNSVFQRFRRWALKGVFERVFRSSVDADFEYVLIDGTIVRLHQHGAGAKGGPKAKPSVAREGGQARRSA